MQRVIRDGETGHWLGLARWRTAPPVGWRRWFGWLVLEVLESEDESLLFTLARGWRPWPGWDVYDAEGRFVGSFHRQVIRDPLGGRFAKWRPATGQFLGPQGYEVGVLAPSDTDLQLTFSPAIKENPFAKMILLAAALIV